LVHPQGLISILESRKSFSVRQRIFVLEIKEVLTKKREEILRIAANRGAYNVRIFGSVVRDDAGPSSDVDFLVDLEPERSLLDVGGLVMDLRNLLGFEVDIVTEKGLHWYIRDRVIAEARPL
jgi:uncharacterized protein